MSTKLTKALVVVGSFAFSLALPLVVCGAHYGSLVRARGTPHIHLLEAAMILVEGVIVFHFCFRGFWRAVARRNFTALRGEGGFDLLRRYLARTDEPKPSASIEEVDAIIDHAVLSHRGQRSLTQETPPPPPRDTSKHAIGFCCYQCGRKLRVPSTRAGKQVRCPGCQATLLVPRC